MNLLMLEVVVGLVSPVYLLGTASHLMSHSLVALQSVKLRQARIHQKMRLYAASSAGM
jgi:hypothetical protein